MASLELCRNRILSDDYRDFVLGWNEDSFLSSLVTEEVCVQDIPSMYRIVYIPRLIADPITLESYNYNDIPVCLGLLDMEALNEAGITQIQNYPTLQLMGKGMMIGFIDTGIDYQNSVFRHIDGTTRIAAIWDQTIQSGTPPEGLAYGSEYTDSNINEALRSENPLNVVPSVDENSHGTFVASIAAGGADPEHGFLGAAPESTIAMVKLKEAKPFTRQYHYIAEGVPCYQDTDVMLGVRYLDDLARKRGMPLVICLALGTNQGGHNGHSPLGEQLDFLSMNDGRIVVLGTGNEADKRHHFYDRIISIDEVKDIEVQVGIGVDGFLMEFWADVPNVMAATVVSPSGEETTLLPAKDGANTVYNFVFERTRLDVDYKLYAKGTHSQLILFRFGNPAPGIWKIRIRAMELADGQFHLWLPLTEFLSGETVFVRSNPDVTLTEPSAVRELITVGYYNGADGGLAISSGRGYTRAGLVKPNLAAPGMNVLGAIPGNRFVTRSGSSIATAITAGAAALLASWSFFELGQSLDTLQMKNMLVFGAVHQPGIEYPNNGWGYGELNLFNTFEQLRKY